MDYFKHKMVLIEINEIRAVSAIQESRLGPEPSREHGKITFKDGKDLTVSYDYAQALQDYLAPVTSEA